MVFSDLCQQKNCELFPIHIEVLIESFLLSIALQDFPGTFQVALIHQDIHPSDGTIVRKEIAHILILQHRRDSLVFECSLKDMRLYGIVARNE